MAVWDKVGDSNKNGRGSTGRASARIIPMEKHSIAFFLNMDIICGAVTQTVALVNVDHGRLDFLVAGM